MNTNQIDEENNPVEEIRTKYSTIYKIVLLLKKNSRYM
jgi:hypothetical protein